MHKILIIIPTYNEIENIKKIIPDIFSRHKNADILIIDDNSPDETGNYAKSLAENSDRIKVINRQKKMGLGTAYIEGFKFALKKGYDFVFQMDADYSHDPAEIKNFIEIADKYDLIIGSRYVKGGKVLNWPKRRLFLSRFANFYARFILGIPISDVTGGFKCFKRKVLELLDLENAKSNGYAFQIEVNFKVWKKGFTVHEIPITFRDRANGRSKISKKIIFEAIFIVLRLRF